MQETANTNVEEEVITNSEDGSDSSSDEQELDIDAMTEDEVRDFAKRERESKLKLKEHLRNKDSKRKPIEDAIRKTEDQTSEETKQTTPTVDEIREETKRIVREEHREERIAQYSNGSTDYLKSQPWAADIVKSDTLYGEFSNEVKRLAEKKDVHSQAEFRKLMRIAAVTVTGKPDALQNESADEEVANDKQQSAGYRPSQPASIATYSGLSAGNRKFVDRINTRRLANGQKSLTPSEVQNILSNK